MAYGDTRIVWDPFLRFAHWAVVAGFAVAYLTEDDLLTVHVWAGYVVGIVVAARIVWGFIGPQYARFSDFVYRPAAVVSYLIDLVRARAPRYLGHSPGGGAMVVALLLCLSATVVTGMALYGQEKKRGPLAGFYTAQMETGLGPAAISTALAKDRAGEDDQNGGEGNGGLLGEFHEVLANVTLGLVILHVAGVLLASVVHRENLVAAMITGRKRYEADRMLRDRSVQVNQRR